jgi:hypothetical protein
MKTVINLKFPIEYRTHKYSLIHFNFFLHYAKAAGVNIELINSTDTVYIADDKLIFSCLINDQQIIFDYADHSTRTWAQDFPNLKYFKFQTTTSNTEIPLGPPMVGVKMYGTKGATVREYLELKNRFKYTPGSSVLCKQIPNGAAIERRNYVHSLLKENFKDIDISTGENQINFWLKHENCLAAICVPGATNNMVDRGHIELVGLGVCTISPELYTLFPWGKKLQPNVEYLMCNDDYSNLVDIIKFLQNTPVRAKEVGINAKHFYDKFYHPIKYWRWIMENIKND